MNPYPAGPSETRGPVRETLRTGGRPRDPSTSLPTHTITVEVSSVSYFWFHWSPRSAAGRPDCVLRLSLVRHGGSPHKRTFATRNNWLLVECRRLLSLPLGEGSRPSFSEWTDLRNVSGSWSTPVETGNVSRATDSLCAGVGVSVRPQWTGCE